MTIQEIYKRINEIRRAAFVRNPSAVEYEKQNLYRDFTKHVAKVGSEDLRSLADEILKTEEITVL